MSLRSAGRRTWRGGYNALFLAALSLPILLVGGSAALSWRTLHRTAEGELRRTADAGAEYAGRVLGAQRLAAELVNQMLSGLDDAAIRAREAELHDRLRGLLPAIPMANTIALSDRTATMLLTANVVPVPRVSIADREWVRELGRPDPPAVQISAVTTGRVDTNVFFGVSIRRAATGNPVPPGAFDGVVNISVDPKRLAAGFGEVTHDRGDVIALIRADGEVLARYPELPATRLTVPPGSLFHAAVASGEPGGVFAGRSTVNTGGRFDGQALSVAYRQVGELPVYVTVSRPPDLVLARWRDAMLPPLVIGLSATGLLGLLAIRLRRGQLRLAEREAEFRAAFDSSVIGKALWRIGDGRLVRVNDRFCEILGRSRAELLGDATFDGLTHPERGPAAQQALRATLLTGEEWRAETRCPRPDGGTVWVEARAARIGTGHFAIGAVQDITERREAEARQTLLAREVDHRAKNALAVVQAALRLTPRDDPARFAAAVEGRIIALARAQTLLAGNRWTGAALRELVEGELAPFLAPRADGAQVARLSGPELRLAPGAVQSLSMTLHELATNAAKHGSLAAPDGRLFVSWQVDAADGVLRLWWEERWAGATDGAPGRSGFGTRVLDATVRTQLGGTLTRDWTAAGLRCVIALPAATVLAGYVPEPAPT